MEQIKQVQQLKINVNNINSVLKASNKEYNKLKKQNSVLLYRKLQREKKELKEKKIESKNKFRFGLGTAKDIVTSQVGNIFDKILGFASFILGGILVNALPGIIKKTKEIFDSIVDFVTPIQSGFNLIKGFFEGDLDKSKYDADKKRVDDKLVELNKDGGLIDQIAEQTGILEPLVKALKPAIEQVRNVVGGKNKVLAVKGGKEGVKDLDTGEFTERQFTAGERKKYVAAGGKGAGGAPSSGAEPSGDNIPVSPGGSFSEGALISALDAVGYTNKNERAMFLAQMAHESGNFRYDEEIWGPTPAQKGYEGRSDLGNNQPGDGYKYRGRGYIQLTGRANYRQYGKLLGVDLENNPDLAKDPNIAARVAIEYWKRRVNRTAAQKGDVKTVTYNINGGYNGLADRIQKYEKYLKKPQPKIKPITRDKNNQASVLNTTMGEEGTTTIMVLRQPVIVG